LGLASLMIQRIAEAHGRNNRMRIGEYLSTGTALQLVMVVLMMAGAALVAPSLPGWMGISGAEARQLSAAFVLAAAANGINILNNGIVGFLRALQVTVVPNVVATIASAAGLVVTFVLLLRGWGVLSIPSGLVAAGALQVTVNLPYATSIYLREVRAPLRPSTATVRDFLTVSGPLLVSKLGSAAMNRSDATLITILLRPELATSYSLTRRAADVVLRLLDRFGAAAFAGFSHLAGSEQRERAGTVHGQIMSVYSGAGALMIGAYVAGNAAFVDLWVGREYYLGPVITVLLGLSILAGGAASLSNYLLSATGRIPLSAWINLAEAVARVPLMLILLLSTGVVGLPVAVLLTAIVAGVVSMRQTHAALGMGGTGLALDWRATAVKSSIIVASAIVGEVWQPDTWMGLALLLFAFCAAAGIALVSMLPDFRSTVLPARLRRPGRTAESAVR
ncbi:MAG: lipopolysaccharide biosynthesis protein, partial [Longimicrobiales bacterium]